MLSIDVGGRGPGIILEEEEEGLVIQTGTSDIILDIGDVLLAILM